MIEIRKTDTFAKWIDSLRDVKARVRILVRIERLSLGNPGDVKPVGKARGYQNYELTMVPAIGSTTRKLGKQ